MKKFLVLLLLGASLHAEPMAEKTGAWNCPDNAKESVQPYLAFTPSHWNGRDPLPLLIFLHGAGFRGNDITKIDADEVPRQIRAGRVIDAIVLCPQSPTYWQGPQVAAFIDQMKKEWAGKFDPDRVYLTGESAGGGGAWEGAKLRAADLAAVVPIASAIGRTDGAEKLVKLPIWAFHNRNDPSQSAEKTRGQAAAVLAAGGKYVFYTEYTATPGKQINGRWPNAHKQAWEAAYNDDTMWRWLFRQRRGRPELALDPAPAPLTDPRGPLPGK